MDEQEKRNRTTEIATSLRKEDGFMGVCMHTLEVKRVTDPPARGTYGCSVCHYQPHNGEFILVFEDSYKGRVAVCVDRPSCRTHAAELVEKRIATLEAVVL